MLLTGFLVAVFFISLFFVPRVFAQTTRDVSFGLQPIAQSIALPSTDIRLIVARVIRAALGLLGIVALVIILYAGYVIMTSGGNEEKVSDGKKILTNAVIGIAIILSALAITQFIINRLSDATGLVGADTGGGAAPGVDSFGASGALGSIIADHYPFRGQTGVHRNTRITVTFREPIDPSSIFEDTNNDGTFGNCVAPPAGQSFSWNQCDRVRTDAVRLSANNAASIYLGMHGIASREGASHQVFTVTFQPDVPLGSDTQNVAYAVDLRNRILKAGSRTSAFAADRDGHYAWNFETDTLFDFTPPTIVKVDPPKTTPVTSVPRNSIIQIQFSKPMDPSSVQGLAGSFTNVLFGDSLVHGNWHITNGYTTLEFLSSDSCGMQNSCGDQIYCLPPSPASCPTSAPNCDVVLVRTAWLLAPSSSGNNAFQSVPLTGVMDMSGNALDGNANGRAEGQPLIPNPPIISQSEKIPDNYFWQFRVTDYIDTTAPYIRQVGPDLDAEGVPVDRDVWIRFSARMWANTLSDIAIVEHGLTPPPLPPFWYRVRATDDATVTHIDHRPFGPDRRAVYYFPTIPSTVKSVTQNCLYPGRGPVSASRSQGAESPLCQYSEADGRVTQNDNCVQVERSESRDTGCVQLTLARDLLQPDIPTCIRSLQQNSPLN